MRAARAIELRGTVRGSPFLVLGEIYLSAFKVHLAPIEAVLLAHRHSGVDGQKKVRQELFESVLDCSAKADLFRVGQKADAPSTLCLPANAFRGIPVDLLIVDANSKIR